MALKGTAAKAEITNKILDTFEGSFLNGKELRIPVIEDGEEVQIKITLTAAKVNIEHVNGTPLSTEAKGKTSEPSVEVSEPTEQEKENLQKLIESMRKENGSPVSLF